MEYGEFMAKHLSLAKPVKVENTKFNFFSSLQRFAGTSTVDALSACMQNVLLVCVH